MSDDENRISALAATLMKKAKKDGKVAWLLDTSTPHADVFETVGCRYCDGDGRQWVVILDTADGSLAPKAGYTSTKGMKGYYKYTMHPFDCPCSQVKSSPFRETNGLEKNELEWSIKHIEGREGKEELYALCAGIVRGFPETAGFHGLYGGYGVGKSGAMKAVVASATRAGIKARYATAAAIIAEVKATFGEGGKTEDAIVRVYSNYPVLMVDEFDRISASEWAQGLLFGILDTRHARRWTCLTMLATNIPPGSDERFGYLESRFLDGQQIIVGGDDMRGET